MKLESKDNIKRKHSDNSSTEDSLKCFKTSQGSPVAVVNPTKHQNTDTSSTKDSLKHLREHQCGPLAVTSPIKREYSGNSSTEDSLKRFKTSQGSPVAVVNPTKKREPIFFAIKPEHKNTNTSGSIDRLQWITKLSDLANMDLLRAFDPSERNKSEEGRLKEVEEAVNKGANINITYSKDIITNLGISFNSFVGNSPLYIAVQKGYISIVKFLMSKSVTECNIKKSICLVEYLIKRCNKNKNKKEEISCKNNFLKIKEVLENYCPDILGEKRETKHIQHGRVFEDLVRLLLVRSGRERLKNKDFSIGVEIRVGEIDDDQKLDDAIFAYKEEGKNKIVLSQFKSKEGRKKIINYDCLNSYSNDYSIYKYFISYLNFKNSPDEGIEEDENRKNLKDSDVEKIIIYTNIDIDVNGLKEKGIRLKDAPKGIVDIFDSSLVKTDSNCKQIEVLVAELQNKLLEESSILHRLARDLAILVLDKDKKPTWQKFVNLSNLGKSPSHFKYYHVALANHVINIEKEDSKSSYIAKFKYDFIENNEEGSKKELREAIFRFIRKFDSSKQSNSDDVLKNFLKGSKFEVGKDFGQTHRNKNKVNNLPDKWDTVTQSDINDFLDRLVFVVNQFNVKDLEKHLIDSINGDAFKSTIFRNTGKTLLQRCNQNIKNNLCKKGGNISGFINGEKTIEDFEDETKQLEKLIEGISITVLHQKSMSDYGKFKNLGSLEELLNNFFNDESKCVLRIITPEITLSSIKLFQYLETNEQYALKSCRRISLNIEEVLKSDHYRETIVESFRILDPGLLTIECKNESCNERGTTDLFNQLSSIIQSNSNKNVILITQEGKPNVLADKFQASYENKGQFLTQNDEINLKDFEAKKDLLEEKLIIFQGKYKKTNFNQLTRISPDRSLLNLNTLDVNTFSDLLLGKEIRVGRSPLGINDLDGAYTELFEEVDKGTLKNNIVNNPLEVVYIVSGINISNRDKAKSLFIDSLELEKDNISDKIDILISAISPGKTIQLIDSSFKANDFKKLCDNHSDKNLYWIKQEASNFILQKVYNPNFYIDRQFNKLLITKSKYSTLTQGIEGHFVFSGISSHVELEVLLNLKILQSDKNRIFVIHDINEARKKFLELNGAVHWLEVENNGNGQEIVWRDSKNSLHGLRKYFCEDLGKNINQENELIQLIKDKKVVIIADDPGMGKSITLIKLYQSLVDSHWVININLKDHLEAIRDINPHGIDILEFLSADKNLNSNRTRSFLKLALDKTKEFQKPLLIAFDGFDEVRDESDRQKVTKLLTHLKDNHTKLWLTTRKQYKLLLEDVLSNFSITFKPLDSNRQRIFIKKFFRDRLSLLLNEEKFKKIFGNTDEVKENSRMYIYTQEFLKKVNSIFQGDIYRFIGIPLQLTLLLGSKGSVEAFKNWAEDNSDSIPNFDYLGKNILEIYENFIDRKYETYFKKKGITEETDKYEKKILYNKSCRKLSGILIGFSTSDITEKYRDIALTFGLIQTSGDNLSFPHPTFEEYFASETFVRWMKKSTKLLNMNKIEFLLKNILIDPNYSMIRKFIDNRLEDEKPSAKYLEECGEIIKKLCKLKSKTQKSKITTQLHISAKEGNKNIASFLLNSIKEEVILKKFINLKNENGETALHITAMENHSEYISNLLNYFKDNPEILKDILTVKNKENDTPLHLAARGGHSACIPNLLNPFKDNPKMLKYILTRKNNQNDTPLHIAVEEKKSEYIYALIKFFKNYLEVLEEVLKAHDERRYTVFHLIAENDFASILPTLCRPFKDKPEMLKYILTMENTEKNTPLHLAALEGHSDCISNLLNPFKDKPEMLKYILTRQNKGKNTRLHLADLEGHSDYIHNLTIQSTGKNTPLHLAALEGYSDCIPNLLNPFKDKPEMLKYILTMENTEKNTPLHLAALEGHSDCIFNLLNPFKDTPEMLEYILTMENTEKNTPLHLATLEGHSDCIFNLLNPFKDNPKMLKYILTRQNKKKNTPLHLAVMQGHSACISNLLNPFKDNPEMLKYILTRQNKKKNTPLHLAVLESHSDCIFNLLNPFKDTPEMLKDILTMQNDQNETPLYMADLEDHSACISNLLNPFKDTPEMLKDILTMQNNQNETFLHLVALEGHSACISNLLNPFKDTPEMLKDILTMEDKKKNTPLHLAALGGHSDCISNLLNPFKDNPKMLKYILTRKNKENNTPLHLAKDTTEVCKRIKDFLTQSNTREASKETMNSLSTLNNLLSSDSCDSSDNSMDDIKSRLIQGMSGMPIQDKLSTDILSTSNSDNRNNTIFQTGIEHETQGSTSLYF